MRALRLVAALCALFSLADLAAAHTRSQSYSTWTRTGAELRVVFTAPARELAQLPPGGAASGFGERLAEHLDARLHAWSGERACESLGPPLPLAATPG